MAEDYVYIGRGEKDLWECRDCGARELPGVFDAEHEPRCEVGEAERTGAETEVIE